MLWDKISDFIRQINSRYLFGFSFALIAIVLVAIPRMPAGTDFTAIFVFWILAIATYGIAVVPISTSKKISWRSLLEKERPTILVISFLAVLAFLLRIWNVASIPFTLSGDEASHGLESLRVISGEIRNPFSTGWLSVPTMSFFGTSFFIRFFGQNVFALRLPAVLIGTATLVPVYLMGKQIKGSIFGLTMAALLAFYHYHIHYSRLSAVQIGDPFFASLAIYFLYRALRLNKVIDWVLLGATTGMAFYFYTGARLIPVLVVAILIYNILFDRREFFKKNRRGILIAIGAFLLVGAPMIQYAIRFPDEFNGRINQVGILQNGWLSNEIVIRGESIWAILWDQFKRAALGFNFYPDRTVWYGLRTPLLDPIFGALFLLGMGFSTLRAFFPRKEKSHFMMAAWWWGAVILGGVLTESPPSSQRMISLVIPVCYFITVALWEILKLGEDIFPKIPGDTIMIFAVIVFGWISLNTYFADYSPLKISGGPNAELANLTAPQLRELSQNHKIYFMGAPAMYWGFSSNEYLVPGADAEDIIEPLSAALPGDFLAENQGAVFVIRSERLGELAFIQKSFPNGIVTDIQSDSDWGTTVTLYMIPPK
jgi:hypothetical protein